MNIRHKRSLVFDPKTCCGVHGAPAARLHALEPFQRNPNIRLADALDCQGKLTTSEAFSEA